MDADHIVSAVTFLLSSGVLAQGLAAFRWVGKVEARLALLEAA